MELYRILREKRHQLHSLSIFIGLWAWWEWPSWPRDRIIPENENDTTFTSEMCGREHFGIGVGHPSASWKYNIVCVGRICQRICRNQSIGVRTYLLTANLTANEAWYRGRLTALKQGRVYFKHGLRGLWSATKMWNSNVESKIAFLLQEISYFEP